MTSIHQRRFALATSVLLLAACASGGTTALPPAPEPQPGEAPAPPPPSGGRGPTVSLRPARGLPYRIERSDSLMLQYEGGASQEQLRDRVAFVRLTLAEAPEPGSFRVTIVLDSLIALDNGMPVPADSALLVRGTEWTASLGPSGQLRGLRASRSSTLGDELAGTLRLLFPRLPQGGVREGMEWTDTTAYELVVDAFPGTETAVTSYRATTLESASIDGRKAIALESSGTYSRSGTRLQGEQELQMTASGTREGTHRIGLEGALLSAQGNDLGEMTISVPALGQTVPVKRAGRFSITSLTAGSR